MSQDKVGPPATLKNATVLLLEDEPLILMALQDELADLACERVRSAHSAAEAMTIIGSQRIDLAVLDLHLSSGRTSLDVAAALRAQSVPFVFATGSDGAELPERFRDAPVLGKPFATGALEIALAQALSMAPARL